MFLKLSRREPNPAILFKALHAILSKHMTSTKNFCVRGYDFIRFWIIFLKLGHPKGWLSKTNKQIKFIAE